MNRIFFILIFLISGSFISYSQTGWTLQQCIEHALKNNLSLKQAEIQTQINENNLTQSKAGWLPSLNAGMNHTYNIGRTIDRYTNTFADQQVLSQNFYISSQFTLWSGLSQVNTIKANQYSWKASVQTVEQQKNDMALSVATSFLQVVYNEELKNIAENQVKISKEQMDRTQKMADAGVLAISNVYDMKAQVANDEYTFTSTKNTYKLALLNLQQLLNLDTVNNFSIERPDIQVNGSGLIISTPSEIYQVALKNQPQIKGAEFTLISSEKTLAAARGRISPSLTMNGSIGTGYSGLAKDITGVNFTGYDTTAITTGGQYVLSPRTEVLTRPTTFNDQFKNNVNKSFGFTLTVPLFNGLQTHTSVKNAKLQVLSSKYNYDLKKQQLYKTIAQAYADAQGAFDKFNAATIALDASKQSFNFTEQKFNVGAISSFDYSTAKNRLLKAQADVLNAKFDFVFKLKVLDYYQGKPLTF